MVDLTTIQPRTLPNFQQVMLAHVGHLSNMMKRNKPRFPQTTKNDCHSEEIAFDKRATLLFISHAVDS